MALINFQFKKNGVEWNTPYANVHNPGKISKNKVISFGIAIYTDDTKENLITIIEDQWVRTVNNVDIDQQCYQQISDVIDNTKASIAELTIAIDACTDDTEKIKLEIRRSNLEAMEILQLDGAVSDEVNV